MTLAGALAAAFDAGDIAAVLLRLAPADDATLVRRIKTVAPFVQDRDAALLIDGHPAICPQVGADGAHLPDVAALEAALAHLKPAHIAGCGGLQSRHDAMLAGEHGADYVMFGEPDARGFRPFETVLERVAWWAEIFVPPCVAWVTRLDEITPLAKAGADFVAVGDGDMKWSDPRGFGAMIAAVRALLKAAEPVS